MFENLVKTLGSTPISFSGLVFPKTAQEISEALKAKRSEIERSIEGRKARIREAIDADNAAKRASVDSVIAAVEKSPYLGGHLTENARKALGEARALLSERAVLEIVALCDDHFDAERFALEDEGFGYDMLDLSFLDLRFLFAPFEPHSIDDALGVLAAAAPRGLGTVMEMEQMPISPVSLSDITSGDLS